MGMKRNAYKDFLRKPEDMGSPGRPRRLIILKWTFRK
jgi:hypothetical protein